MSEGTVWDGRYPSSPSYPVVYRVVSGVRIYNVVVALFIEAAVGIFALLPIWSGRTSDLNPVLVAISLVMTLSMGYFVWWTFSARVVLREGAIEQVKPFGTCTFRAGDIKGCKCLRRASNVMIAANDGRVMYLSGETFQLDRYFNDWFATLPNLDEVENKEEVEYVSNNPSLGATSAERIAEQKRRDEIIGRIYGGMLFASLVIFFGTMTQALMNPALLAAAALPWCLPILFYFDRKSPARAGSVVAVLIFIPMVIPLVSLIVMALWRANLVDAQAVIDRGVLIGFPLWLLFAGAIVGLKVSNAQKIVACICAALLAWAYGASVLAIGNRLLDQASPQIYSVEVVGKYLTKGRGAGHYFQLGAWGPVMGGTSLNVNYDTYYSVHKGDAICMGLYPGRFGYQWFQHIDCPAEIGAR